MTTEKIQKTANIVGGLAVALLLGGLVAEFLAKAGRITKLSINASSLIIGSALFLLLCVALITGEVALKFGENIRRKEQPILYWVLVTVLALIAASIFRQGY